MKLSYTTLCLAFVTLCSSCTNTNAEASKVNEKDAEVIDLFDGESLKGWKKVGGTGEFKVEDGTIVGYGENVRGNTFLRTEKTYGDFELTYEFKFDDRAGNSGVMFRALQKPHKKDNGRVYGYQCEGDNSNRSWSAGLFDEARRGWLFPDKKNKKQCNKFSKQGRKLFKWDEWNTFKIRCKGNHIETWLNGEKRVDFIDENAEHDTREGFFALQVHSGKASHVRWRNIKLKQL